MLLRLYTFYADAGKPAKTDPEAPHMNGHTNGSIMSNGHARSHFSDRASDGRSMRDAEEFELDGLMSDDEDSLAKPEGTSHG